MKVVRNGQKVWPYCESCGCRLDIFYNNGKNIALVSHYYLDDPELLGTDASGCKCQDIERIWNVEPAQLIGVSPSLVGHSLWERA
jgi:hypothetical protein